MFSKRICAFALLAVMLLGIAVPGMAEVNKSINPLVDAQSLERARGGDDVINVLLLGNEYGSSGQSSPSANSSKKAQEIGLLAYHTDAIMVLSVNRTQGKINLISIPRDTLTYVPGVYGVYKVNCAFNCATTVKEGIRHTRDAVSWLLGGVKIDNYVFVDMEAMITLGNAMGGVDFDLDYSYKGTSGRSYTKGYQHLDGRGIMDYVRARKHIDSNDQNRAERGRRMVSAIIQKLWGDWDLVDTLWSTANKSSVNFYTDLESGDLLTLYETVQKLKSKEIGSLALTGRYDTGTTCGDFQFRIVDQDNRIQVLKTAFGIDAEPLPYSSVGYINWLFRGNGSVTEGETITQNRYSGDGFDFVKHLHKGRKMLETAYDLYDLNRDQQASVDTFEGIYNEFLAAFEDAAYQASTGNYRATIDTELLYRYEKALQSLSGTLGAGKVYYTHGHYWEKDSFINEYSNIDWR